MFVNLSRKKFLACLVVVLIGLAGLKVISGINNHSQKTCLKFSDEVQTFLDLIKSNFDVCCEITVQNKINLNQKVCIVDNYIDYFQRNLENYSAKQIAKITEASLYNKKAAKALQNEESEYADLLFSYTLELVINAMLHDSNEDQTTNQVKSADSYSLQAIRAAEAGNAELAAVLGHVGKVKLFSRFRQHINSFLKIKPESSSAKIQSVEQELLSKYLAKIKPIEKSLFRFWNTEKLQAVEEKALLYGLEAIDAYQDESTILEIWLELASKAYGTYLVALAFPDSTPLEKYERKYQEIIDYRVQGADARKNGEKLLSWYFIALGFDLQFAIESEEKKQFSRKRKYEQAIDYSLTAVKLEKQGAKRQGYNYYRLAEAIVEEQISRSIYKWRDVIRLQEAASYFRTAIRAEENGNKELSEYSRTLATCIHFYATATDSQQRRQYSEAIRLARAVVAAYSEGNLSKASQLYKELNTWLNDNDLEDYIIQYL